MFELKIKDVKTKARRGLLNLARGKLETPVFMPVATKGCVKTLTPQELEEIGAEIILGNTYHLYLKPGLEVIKKHSSLNAFMGWTKPVLTDSGGFQIFSLSGQVKITPDGARFKSVYDGSEHFFTPEKVMEIQNVLGADIAMVLDDVVSYPVDYQKAKEAVLRTTDWAKKSKKAHKSKNQKLFGIVQGSTYGDLRKKSLEDLLGIGFDGYAVGGLSVGEPEEKMFETIEQVIEGFPEDKPRYLMGVGSPRYLVKAIALGIDMFDSVLPTRMARNGSVYTTAEKINIRNARFAQDLMPLDESCHCYVCNNFSRSYLRHLFLNNEILAHRLLTWHNLFYIVNLVKQAREAIGEGSLSKLVDSLPKD